MCLLALATVLLMSTSATAQRYERDFLGHRFQASVSWRGSQTIPLTGLPSQIREVPQFQDGQYQVNSTSLLSRVPLSASAGRAVEAQLVLRLYRRAFIGGTYTHHGLPSDEDWRYVETGADSDPTRWYGVKMGDQHLSATIFFASSWERAPRYSEVLRYRGVVGFNGDLTGRKMMVENGCLEEDPYTEMKIGRLREHRIFVSVQVGLQPSKQERSSVIFVSLTYHYSIYSFSPEGEGSKTALGDNNAHGLYFSVGLSLL